MNSEEGIKQIRIIVENGTNEIENMRKQVYAIRRILEFTKKPSKGVSKMICQQCGKEVKPNEAHSLEDCKTKTVTIQGPCIKCKKDWNKEQPTDKQSNG